MALYQVKLPKMGESVAEATITKWLKAEGDAIAIDEELVEIATDKVDSDVTSEVEGVLKELHFKENEVVPVGAVMAVIETDNTHPDHLSQVQDIIEQAEEIGGEGVETKNTLESVAVLSEEIQSLTLPKEEKFSTAERYFSPLVRSIAKTEGISKEELQALNGTGKEGRITKKDIFSFLEKRKNGTNGTVDQKPIEQVLELPKINIETTKEDRIHTLSRTEKLISEHMQISLSTSAHVQSFIEADVTDLWNWRESAKDNFIKQEGARLTFTPLFMMAVIKALKDYPQLNSSVNGDQVIIKKNINMGMATALSDGNLIVPVIQNADHLNIVGLAKVVNDLADRARSNKLKPYEVQEGSYTVTNIGNFGSLMGTPIINQPQVGILAIGTILKTPAVIETPEGDFIGIRRKVMLSHSYDHRIINGATGGLFVKRVAEYLENWNEKLPY
tara:strand:- start:1404 stop:2738 length:1335 start_codon:yes stop_codon:yes gene_type:complete